MFFSRQRGYLRRTVAREFYYSLEGNPRLKAMYADHDNGFLASKIDLYFYLIFFGFFFPLPLVFPCLLFFFTYYYEKKGLRKKGILPIFEEDENEIYDYVYYSTIILSNVILLSLVLFFSEIFPWLASLILGQTIFNFFAGLWKFFIELPLVIIDGFFEGLVIRLSYVVYVLCNWVVGYFALVKFERWQEAQLSYMQESRRHGTATTPDEKDLKDYDSNELGNKNGIYIGNDSFVFNDQGHILTCAGTRSGKGTNLIIPNLLGKSEYDGSWVVIDPKGENAKITAEYQKKAGRKVVVLNPWNLHGIEGKEYNPLSPIKKGDTLDLFDDASEIANLIVPTNPKDNNPFWDNSARALVKLILMHIATEESPEKQHLGMLWEILHSSDKEWDNFLTKAIMNESPVNGKKIKKLGNSFIAQKASEKTWKDIIVTTKTHIDIFGSPHLEASFKRNTVSGLDLIRGNTTLYVIIPANNLVSHNRWLRLVITSLMHEIIKKPGKQVTFLLDEFYSLGYMSVIKVALALYAGYNIKVWAIIHDLSQLKELYGDSWESFITNSRVKHFFGLDDNFTSEYLQRMFGTTSVITHGTRGYGLTAMNEAKGATARPLYTSDEITRKSENIIFTVINRNPVAEFKRVPYFEDAEIVHRASKRPFIKNDDEEPKKTSDTEDDLSNLHVDKDGIIRGDTNDME